MTTLTLEAACRLALIEATDGLELRFRGEYTAVVVDEDDQCAILAELHLAGGRWFAL